MGACPTRNGPIRIRLCCLNFRVAFVEAFSGGDSFLLIKTGFTAQSHNLLFCSAGARQLSIFIADAQIKARVLVSRVSRASDWCPGTDLRLVASMASKEPPPSRALAYAGRATPHRLPVLRGRGRLLLQPVPMRVRVGDRRPSVIAAMARRVLIAQSTRRYKCCVCSMCGCLLEWGICFGRRGGDGPCCFDCCWCPCCP